MSLDLHLEVDYCFACGRADGAWWRNATHNLVSMWQEAGVYSALYESDGARAGNLLDALRIGLADMTNRPEAYRALSPSNGWGSYEGAVDFLESLIRKCTEFPEARVRVCR